MDEYIIDEVMLLSGIWDKQSAFRPHIILYLNEVFSTLQQLGAGPPEGFYIRTDSMPTWSEFTEDKILLGFVKGLVVAKVTKRFNPPANATLMSSIDEAINENTNRIIYHMEEVKNQNE